MSRFTDKVVIVTGAGAGIGKATASLFAAEGARVTIAERDPNSGEAAMRSIRDQGGEAQLVTGDISLSETSREVRERTIAAYGTIDVLINNAGVELKSTVEETSEQDWDRVLATNLKSAFLMSKEVIPTMKEKGSGAIVMNSSVAYYIGAPRSAAYGASKAGLIALARCMALELAPFNIRVNAVCPGVIDTPMNERNLARSEDPESMRASWFAATPLNRLGQAEDVAKAMLFLASDDAAFITGSPLIIDGGRLAQ